jgi:hypothetical protein
MVTYRFEDSRDSDCAARHLGDFRGILKCDGYSGYRKRCNRGTPSHCLEIGVQS